MSVTLYFDVHVRRAVTEGLRLRGVDILTAQEEGAATMDDPVVLDRAMAYYCRRHCKPLDSTIRYPKAIASDSDHVRWRSIWCRDWMRRRWRSMPRQRQRYGNNCARSFGVREVSMAPAERKQRYTLEEYLALERDSEGKYEFWDGEIFAMSGGTLGHNMVMDNVAALLHRALQGKPCRVFSSNQQIKVPAAPPYRYADGSVVCGTTAVERLHGNDLLLNPVLLYEVLSPSTEGFDRGDKFTSYKSIPTLGEYLLIAQHRPHITQYVKQPDGMWRYTEVNDLDSSLYLPSIDVTLQLSEVYQDVDFAGALESPGIAEGYTPYVRL